MLDVDTMLGLDDIAHNRLYVFKDNTFVQVANYGKRNEKERCYCKELARFGVKRKGR